MTIERPMFPPRGDSNVIVKFPGSRQHEGTNLAASEPQEEAPSKKRDWRTRERIREDIDLHVAARAAYGKAVAWEAAAESGNLPQSQIEETRKRTAQAFQEMTYRAQMLVVVMPTDGRALVDLLLYLEQNFSVLPQECNGRSLAFNLLRTMRLSLRKVEHYGVGR
jgi:hypothetical protein